MIQGHVGWCKVTIEKPFFIGITEVTQEQYEAVMGANPSTFKGAKNPVDGVSWDDAREFCRRLSQCTRYAVRLPTEVEWEYACRAGTTTLFNTGPTISIAQANYDGGSDFPRDPGERGDGPGRTVAVGGFAPNAWGLYDMHGNVLEWCEDECEYLRDMNDGLLVKSGREFREIHVLRGGSWYLPGECCSSKARCRADPASRCSEYGMRVCVEAK